MQNVSLIGTWLLLVVFLFVQGDPSLWFEPLSFGVVIGAPFALACARRGPRRTLSDMSIAWSPNLKEAPPASLAPAAANLHSMGADALSIGVLFAFANVIAMLRSLAKTADDPAVQLVGELGALMVAPMVGLAVKTLFCDLLAKRVESAIFPLHDPASAD